MPWYRKITHFHIGQLFHMTQIFRQKARHIVHLSVGQAHYYLCSDGQFFQANTLHEETWKAKYSKFSDTSKTLWIFRQSEQVRASSIQRNAFLKQGIIANWKYVVSSHGFEKNMAKSNTSEMIALIFMSLKIVTQYDSSCLFTKKNGHMTSIYVKFTLLSHSKSSW